MQIVIGLFFRLRDTISQMHVAAAVYWHYLAVVLGLKPKPMHWRKYYRLVQRYEEPNAVLAAVTTETISGRTLKAYK